MIETLFGRAIPVVPEGYQTLATRPPLATSAHLYPAWPVRESLARAHLAFTDARSPA
jgi:hypothetical protein